MRIAVGVDVGFASRRTSAGLVVMDRDTKAVAVGTTPATLRLDELIAQLRKELAALPVTSASFVVDGPFAAALNGRVRAVETFFQTGPFCSAPPDGAPKLRLMPAPTGRDSIFLAATRKVVEALGALGFEQFSVTRSGDGTRWEWRGEVGETFPTMYMACLLEPHTYSGPRSTHSDDLWSKAALGSRDEDGASAPVVPFLLPYTSLIRQIERSPAERHDLRAAAVCAIAADGLAGSTSGEPSSTFFGNEDEHGFLLPPAQAWNDKFREVVEIHWRRRAPSGLIRAHVDLPPRSDA